MSKIQHTRHPLPCQQLDPIAGSADALRGQVHCSSAARIRPGSPGSSRCWSMFFALSSCGCAQYSEDG